MASIHERNGRWKVIVRMKGFKGCRTFSDRETAELWGKWKEDLANDMDAFEFKAGNHYLVGDAIDLMVSHSASRRDQSMAKVLSEEFEDWANLPMASITFDMFVQKAEEMTKKIVRKGGLS